MNDPTSLSPLVSVVMCTYNRAPLIAESIQSVCDQTYTRWELIIIDDGSTDDTRDVVAQFHDARIRYFSHPHIGHIGKLRNIGFRHAQGELIAFHDSDDLWRNDKLTRQVEMLHAHPGAMFVLSNGNQIGPFAISVPDYQPFFFGNIFGPLLIGERFCFYAPSLIFRKIVLDDIGVLDESVSMMRELQFFLRMSHRYDGIFTNEKLVSIRKHTLNTSSTYLVDSLVESLRMIDEFYHAGALTKTQHRLLSANRHYKIGLFYLHHPGAGNGVENFRQYLRRRPWHYKGWIRMAQALIKKNPVSGT